MSIGKREREEGKSETDDLERKTEGERDVRDMKKFEFEFEFEFEFIFVLQRLQIRQDASFHLAVNTEL